MSGKELMRGIVAAFEKSEIKPLLDALDDEVVWKSASREANGPFSFKGNYRNRAGVIEVLAQIAKNYTFEYMRAREIVEEGDTVWGLFDTGVRYDAKGRGIPARTAKLEIAIRWRLRNGKIVEHQAFFDTAHLFMQQTGGQA